MSSTAPVSSITQKRIPPPPPPPRFVPSRDQVIQVDPPAPPASAATGHIPVDPQDLEIPEAFWGILYETASHMVGHAYRACSRDLRAIEERSPKNVMESALGMTFTFALAQHRSITRARARNDELQAEINAAKTALTAAQEGEQATKAAFPAAQKSEYDAKFALAPSQESEQAAKIALASLQAQNAQLQAKADEAKAKLLEAEAAVKEEKAASLSSMEDMLYHNWAFNQDDNFSFMAPVLWEPYLEKFKA
ncbi:uncharacterized protein LOC133818242 [Humulus lupulus]|uniref:uncharacterized protein LOC133818242 n=1 Tax=Humulus lupulus TaxID=3486 RepID=UPI002B417FCF|nr:uncharacterized protein LOC133818242 [Humulus lupulus]XP_062106982.1 uncharacterized protein LOC133818242 [Humulus lupulus]